jgi:hypothetical protein
MHVLAVKIRRTVYVNVGCGGRSQIKPLRGIWVQNIPTPNLDPAHSQIETTSHPFCVPVGVRPVEEPLFIWS